ncbi:hypothetical protein ACHAWF_004559 [Thalassiosira exigua]
MVAALKLPRLAGAILCLCWLRSGVRAFSALGPAEAVHGWRAASAPLPLHLAGSGRIIDAEVVPDDEASAGSSDDPAPPPQTLVEYSQNQDPDWKSMPVAFCDVASNTYVDCQLAFYVKDPLGDPDEGAEYALGVPCEVPIVVALEVDGDSDGPADGGGEDGVGVINLSRVVPVEPDDGVGILGDEEKEEVFQLAARALMDEFGSKIRLKKTPRVLTIEGDLDASIGDWKEVLLGSAGSGMDSEVGIDQALNAFEDEDEDDDDDDFFDAIMKRDLGPDYMKLVEEDDGDSMDEELLKLFDLEGLDGEDLGQQLEEIDSKEKEIKGTTYDQLVQRLQPSAALRLLNFLGPGGKEYTILRPLRPILLVGKEDPDDYTRRILLSDEERVEVLPRLENACRKGVEEAGFFLAGSSEES